MKEATGEASLTVVTIILIAAVLAAATIILTNVMGNIQKQAENATNGTGNNNQASAISTIFNLE